MVSSVTTFATVAAAAVLSGSAQAHQTVYIPAPTFTTTDKVTKTNPIAFLENQGFKPTEDINGFLKKYKTLREFMDDSKLYKSDAAGATFECGYTDPKGTRQAVPANGMMRSSGFTHEGPCEIWIDDTKVLGGPEGNCHKDIPGQPVSYKVDFSSCKGDCTIHWYWLAKRLIGSKWSWQAYKECIPIRGGAAAPAPPVATNATAAVTKAPAAETGKDGDSATPMPATTKPPAATPAPSTTMPVATAAPVATTEQPVAGEASAAPSKGSKGCRRLLD